MSLPSQHSAKIQYANCIRAATFLRCRSWPSAAKTRCTPGHLRCAVRPTAKCITTLSTAQQQAKEASIAFASVCPSQRFALAPPCKAHVFRKWHARIQAVRPCHASRWKRQTARCVTFADVIGRVTGNAYLLPLDHAVFHAPDLLRMLHMTCEDYCLYMHLSPRTTTGECFTTGGLHWPRHGTGVNGQIGSAASQRHGQSQPAW